MGAKGGKGVNHDCHDLGMMGMMHRRPCPVDSCLRRNDVVMWCNLMKGYRIMQRALHIKTTVLPGGKIEIVDEELAVGESVDVVVHRASGTLQRSAVDILGEAPGHRLFNTAEDVNSFLKDERASWER